MWQTASGEDRARKIARNGNGLMIGAFHGDVIFHQLRAMSSGRTPTTSGLVPTTTGATRSR
jgi:hypothetical protein